jgi:hypothetical protein
MQVKAFSKRLHVDEKEGKKLGKNSVTSLTVIKFRMGKQKK